MKMVTRKGFVFITIILLIGTGFIPATNSSSNKTVTAQVYGNGLQPVSSGFFDPRMKIPEHCFNLSKAPSEYEYKGIKYKEEFNFPIGTFGNNYISYGPHGIDRIALYNNFFDAFGGYFGTGSHNPRCLDGTFLGVFMNKDENKVTKLLQQHSPTNRGARDYGLQSVEKMGCWSNIPMGYYRYQDSEFPAEVGLIVYSPVLLYDVKNSSLPVSIWVFNAYNPTDTPVEVSFLFSLENDIGWRSKVNDDSSWQRTGTYNYIHKEGDRVGVKFTYDEDLMSMAHPEYLGTMTLATFQQPDVTISYVSEWGTLGDGNDLLATFSTNGTLSNQDNTERAVEGEHIYAGALSAKVLLEPGEGKNIPFVLATCFPIFNLSNMSGMPSEAVYEWYWTNYFNDSWDIATYALENHEAWWRNINDWQEKLYSSGLPPEMMTYMMGSLTNFVSSVFFSKEGYWFTVSVPLGSFENVVAITYTNWFLCMFYPEIVKYSAREHCKTIYEKDGFCPGCLWNSTGMLHQDLSFIIHEYRAWMWNQDDIEFLHEIYPYCKKVIEYRIKQDVNEKDGLIHNGGNDLRNDQWAMPTSSALNSLWLLSLKCMVSMAKHLNDSDNASYFEEWFETAQRGFIDRLWYEGLKYEYFKLCAEKFGWWAQWQYPHGKEFFDIPKIGIPILIRDSHACMIEQIIGAWHGRLIDEDILPLEKTKTALNSVYNINCDHDHGYGWINAVMGNPPCFIDRFGTYFYNVPNRITPVRQWTFATSLLTHGSKKEGIHVANITKERQLYENGGVYVTYNDTVFLCGTNKRNRVGESFKDFIKGKFFEPFISGLITGNWNLDLEHVAYYPPRLNYDLPSWALYQAAAGFTPCIGGLKIKPRVGGEDVFYMTQYAGCKIEMNVTGTGNIIETVEINGAPYTVIVDGKVFIPLENFIEQDKMFIHITF